jgi:hypothetical protein
MAAQYQYLIYPTTHARRAYHAGARAPERNSSKQR